jgi:hypothetical protein
MKHLIFPLMILMTFQSFSQKVYDEKGRESIEKEKIKIEFSPSQIDIPQEDESVTPAVIALIPTAIDLGFKITNDILEKNIEKFSGEYTVQNSYLDAGTKTVPDFIITRKVLLKSKNDNSSFTDAIKLDFEAQTVSNLPGLFFYNLKSIDLDYSKAKTKRKGKTLNYIIEIKPTFIVNGEKKVQELSPINVNSVEFGTNNFDNNDYRTDFIALPKNSILSELSVKIVESNPYKIKTEKLLNTVTKYKEDAKTIINNFINQDEEDESSDSEDETDTTVEVTENSSK